MTTRSRSLLAATLAFVGSSVELQAQNGVIEGRVLDGADKSVTDAEVRLVDLGRVVRTDEKGFFRISNVPSGSYAIAAASPRAGRGVATLTVSEGATTEIEIRVSLVFHGQEIIVTTTAPRPQAELFRAADAIEGADLRGQAEASLGETLGKRPGVNSSYFGPGASRPIIRGLSGDRVRMLERGISSGDASATSPDHSVSTDATSSDRIEILRGPATLLYGSSAIGGVVNVLDQRIPTERHPHLAAGRVLLRGSSVSDEANAAGEINLGTGPVAIHVAGMYRNTNDYRIPGEAFDASLLPDLPGAAPAATGGEGASGRLPNSDIESWRAAVGGSYIASNGYVGGSWLGYDTNYGIPGGDADGESGARIDLQQRRVDAEGAWRFGGTLVKGLKARFGITDYRHFEVEPDGEIGTTFTNDQWEGRAELQHQLDDAFQGTLGVQLGHRDFSALGEEAFISPTETTGWGVFLVEELSVGPIRFGAGARFDHRQILNKTDRTDRSDDAISASLGVNWLPVENIGLGLTGSRSVKYPSAEELFSYGPHLATRSFEIGDPTLANEVGYSVEAAAWLTDGLITGSLAFFHNWFDDFIFQSFTGEIEEGFPVLLHTQSNASFVGLEGSAQFEVLHIDTHHLLLDLQGDYVRAGFRDGDEPLPLIPPLRLGAAAHYRGSALDARIALRWVDDQNRTFELEAPTPGYAMLDVGVGLRLFSGSLTHRIELRGTNVTDEMARVHSSLVKAWAPLPGRDIRLVYELEF